MKAILLAGGQGTRLKAVTGDLPKPLVPLLGRPLAEHILRLLRRHGFTEVCAALRYRPEELIRTLGDGSRFEVSLEYRTEERELGTAGAVKNCSDFIAGDEVLIISGDAACDLDLTELLRRHRERNAAVTLALHRNEAPLRFGLAVTDEEDTVRAFVEKPSWSRVVTDLVNTGIYILSPRAMDAIPADCPFDFAKDLFPLLLQRGELLLGVPLDGYWCDVGTPLSYYRCCVDALEGKLKLEPGPGFQKPAKEDPPSDTVPDGFALELPCRDRAALMGRLSRWMLELPAEFGDGIRLHDPRYELHICPESQKSALQIAVNAQDAEFAKRLAFSVRDLAKALEV